MTATEKKAYENISCGAEQFIWQMVNTAYDDRDSIDWVLGYMKNEDGVVEDVYEECTTMLFAEGYCCWNKSTVTKFLREINFLGKERLMEMVRERVKVELEQAIDEVEGLKNRKE